MKELKRLDVAIAGIQETKWFGKDVWNANGFTLLHSGRTMPDESEPQVRNEGVGIVLNERATTAWKDAGEIWEAVSSRVVSARLKIVRRGQRRPGGSRETRNTYLSVVSVYVPTAQGSPRSQGQVYRRAAGRPWIVFHQVIFSWCWETSMPELERERKEEMCGDRQEGSMGLVAAMKPEKGYSSCAQSTTSPS